MGIVIKFIGTNYPSIQLSFFRNFFGILPIIIFMFFSGEIKNYNFFPKIPLIWLAILRGGFLAFAQLCFFISLLFRVYVCIPLGKYLKKNLCQLEKKIIDF